MKRRDPGNEVDISSARSVLFDFQASRSWVEKSRSSQVRGVWKLNQTLFRNKASQTTNNFL